jgi:hypothetical protein
MSHLFRSIGIVLTSGTFLFACDSPNNPLPSQDSRSVSFVDQGAVVPAPVRTVVTVNPDFIFYASARLDTPLVSWFSKILAQDFAHLTAIVEQYNLTKAPDPALPQGQNGCVGSRAMNIVMVNGATQDTLTIPGPMRCANLSSLWPAGLDSLLAFEESLVQRYRPSGAP